MQTQRKLSPGQKGAKKFSERFGDQLVCVRYRYDKVRHKRFTTVEIIVDDSAWSPPVTPTPEPSIVGLHVAFTEVKLQPLVKQAGGKWSRGKSLWEIQFVQAPALGLKL